MKRNRIVINLDQNQPGAARGSRSRRRFGRVLLLIAIVLLVVVGGVAAGGYFWWRHYQSGPAYSLALLAEAAQRNDSATVDAILDTDKITADFVVQVRSRLPASSSVASVFPQTDSIRDSLSAKLKDTVHEQLMKELQDLSSVAHGKPFIVVALGIPYFADIKQEDNTAQVTVHVKDEQIKLTMQAEGERWRITAVQDEKLAKIVADAVVRSMPSNGSQVQDSIRKQIEGLKW